MRRIYKTIVVGAIAALALVSGPAAAPAQDGKLHAWEHPPGHGFHCSWENKDF